MFVMEQLYCLPVAVVDYPMSFDQEIAVLTSAADFLTMFEAYAATKKWIRTIIMLRI